MIPLLQSIAAILFLTLFMKMVEFIVTILKKKSELSEKSIADLTSALRVNTAAVEKLDARIAAAEKTMAELPKLKLDLRRLFTAVKRISGDDWEKIRKEIMDDVAM